MSALKLPDFAIDAASYNVSGVPVLTAARVLQNVTLAMDLITSGELDDDRLSVNVPLLDAASNAFSGVLGAASYELAGTEIISSAGVLHNVSVGAALLTGTIDTARLPAAVAMLDAETPTFTGALSAASLSTGGAVAGGSYKLGATEIITAEGVLQNVTLAAGSITGDVADGQLSANVPLLNAASNTFTGGLTAASLSTEGAASAGSYALGATTIVTSEGALQNIDVGAALLTGTIDDDRLSTNIPRLDAEETTFGGQVTATVFFTSSTREVKRAIAPLDLSALGMLRTVRIMSYTYRDDAAQLPRVGFIAEDTDPLLSGPDRRVMDHANAIGLLIRAVQELDVRTRA